PDPLRHGPIRGPSGESLGGLFDRIVGTCIGRLQYGFADQPLVSVRGELWPNRPALALLATLPARILEFAAIEEATALPGSLAEHGRNTAPVLEEIFLEQRDDLVAHRRIDRGAVAAADEERVADAVLAVDEIFDPVVELLKHLAQRDAVDILRQKRRVRSDLAEYEAPPQRGVEQCDRAVGGVHRADDVEVTGHAELAFRVRQTHCQRIGHAEALVRLQQRDQLAEDFGDIGAVDLVDDEDVLQDLAVRLAFVAAVDVALDGREIEPVLRQLVNRIEAEPLAADFLDRHALRLFPQPTNLAAVAVPALRTRGIFVVA